MARPERVICEAAALSEGGKGARFAWAPAGGEGKGFAIRFDGAVRAFVNRCPHTGVELDWLPGEFFEESGLYLICSTHGALFEPSTGLCVAGPCKGARLQAIAVEEREGRIIIHEDRPEPASGSGSPETP